ncbi:VOC family protein [Williamsia sterculiae]|uniref:VOC family protein n=1 Tax=Williamsia sterculiae TaxID=1344003 RepID=UPI00135630E9|nr:VOC family protein [Williamsia sterculiae]
MLFQHSTSAPSPSDQRCHLDLRPAAGDQDREVAHLLSAGARLVGDDADLPWVVLADPDGDRFCVLPVDDDDHTPQQ